jgi:replication factor C large subunit
MEWTVKYSPKSTKDLVGNKPNYSKLMTWLTTYYSIKNKDKTKDFKYIALLVGPPGIGKTSGIVAIAKELHFEIIEFNASDQRNEKVITRLVGRETRTKVNEGYKGRIVLLDEVDGIQGREDKGGLSALMKLAKESNHPIICTANDPQSDKIRSLKKATSTLTLTFKKPDITEMIALLENIAILEGISVPKKLLTVICENSRGDIRGALNDLENLSQERKDVPMNAIQALSIRDAEVSIDLALRQIFGEAKTLKQAQEVTMDLDVDYSMFMHYILENIPAHSSYASELTGMFSNAAQADLFYGRIMQSQHWKYLKYYFYFLSAGIRASKTSPYKQNFPRFPSGLMVLSRTKKVRGIRNSVTSKFGKLTHSSRSKINNFSLPYIRLLFEKLFEFYENQQLETPRGQKLLVSISEIQNYLELDEDEFMYLFNDPSYASDTGYEKNQKKLIKIIQEKSLELREQNISKRNDQLNAEGKFKFTNQVGNKNEIENVLLQEITTSQNSHRKKISASKRPKKNVSVKISQTDNQLKEESESDNMSLDNFDLEEKILTINPKNMKKNPLNNEMEDPIPESQQKEKKKTQKKEKKKSLFEFTNTETIDSEKKKKDSKNLMDFL